MHPKDADGMANSVDPDQTASSEAVWSWSALFAETYLSQYIEFIRYDFRTLTTTTSYVIAFTHCILVDSSTVICWMSPFAILGVSGKNSFILFWWKLLLANNVGHDQMPHYVFTVCLRPFYKFVGNNGFTYVVSVYFPGQRRPLKFKSTPWGANSLL